MLEGLSNRVPTAEELDRANDAAWKAKGPVEYLQMSLERIATGGRTVGLNSDVPTDLSEPLTAEQAWQLTYFANGIDSVGDELTGLAREIRSSVRGIYQDALDAAAREEAS
jgi:hypothetical protein